ncbi:MAG TPA: response regulator [Chloroflexia bacterium]|nr:response regulator [Chloroflexia bacterium]
MNKRVLVIEDSISQAALTRLELEKLGYEVKVVYDGPEGIEAAKDYIPGVIILDCNLPSMSGMDVCRALKNQPETRIIPVIMFSVDDRLTQMSNAFSAGVDFYVTKDRSGSKGLPRLVEAVYQKYARAAGSPASAQ